MRAVIVYSRCDGMLVPHRRACCRSSIARCKAGCTTDIRAIVAATHPKRHSKVHNHNPMHRHPTSLAQQTVHKPCANISAHTSGCCTVQQYMMYCSQPAVQGRKPHYSSPSNRRRQHLSCFVPGMAGLCHIPGGGGAGERSARWSALIAKLNIHTHGSRLQEATHTPHESCCSRCAVPKTRPLPH